MLDNGIAWLGEDQWSVTVQLGDVSYLIQPQPEQEDVLNRWARWLNSHSGGVDIQQTVVNEVLEADSFGRIARLPLAGDANDAWREEVNRHIVGKLATKRGNVLTRRYITFTITESDHDKAQEKLLRLVSEATSGLRAIGSDSDGLTVHRLNRAERLALLASLTRRGEPFEWSDAEFNGGRTNTKDAITPWSVEDKGSYLILTSGGRQTYHTTVWLRALPSWLTDRLIADLADLRGDLTITSYRKPYDAADGLDLVSGQIANLEMQYMAEQKKLSKQNLSLDLIPHSLQVARTEAKDLRQDLEKTNQHLWSTLTVIGVSADSRDAMDALVDLVMTSLRSHSCAGEVITRMCLDGLRSELPLGSRQLPMERTLTTSSIAVMHPFTTQELMQRDGFWYGANARSGNPLLVNRRSAVNGNGFFLGISGGGKSQGSKFEAVNVLLNTNDDIVFIDPENEYTPLVNAFGQQVITVSSGGATHINPMDVNLSSTADDPILSKATFILRLMEALVGGIDGLTAQQRSIVDRCTVAELRKWAADPTTTPPTLVDLRRAIQAMDNPEANELAAALELYTDGSLQAFAQQTNVNMRGRMVCYRISELSPELKSVGMMIILDQIWNRVVENRDKGKRTWLYVDEFHMMFRNPHTAEFFLVLWKRARKWGLMPTGVTQDIEELLENGAARLMLANSDFLALFNQAATNAEALKNLLKISDEQASYFSGVNPGHGLLKSGGSYVPFDNEMDTSTELFRMLSTKFVDAP